MILEDFTAPIKNPDRVVKEVYDTFDHAKLDVVLAECCAGVVRGQQMNPDLYGMVGACVVDEKDRLVFGINYLTEDGTRVHAERAAIEKYVGMYGRVPYNSIIVTTCSPCSAHMDERHGDSCTQLLDDYGIRRVYAGFEDPTQNDTVLFNNRTFDIEVTDNQKLRDLCRRLAETFLSNDVVNEDWRKTAAAVGTAGALALGGSSAVQHNIGVGQQAKAVASAAKSVLNNPAAHELAKIAKAAGMRGDEFAQFMAQCAVETGNFTNFTELGKNHKKYEPGTKMGKILGNKHKGDGDRYKGRGYIQLTGRENYQRAGQALGIDLVNHPELLDKPDVAGKVAVWYWQSKVQPRVDDFKDTRQVTKPINGGLKHLKHRDDKYKEFKLAQLAEVLSLTHIGKRGNLDNLPNHGKPLPKNADIKKELGELVGKMSGGLEVYRFKSGQSTAYTVFDPQTRCAQIAVSGNRYSGNADSFIIFGVYAGPDNKTRAADLYAWLIRELGLTLVSDYQQSSGGQRVWQELQKRYGRSFNIYGFDTKTNKPVNLTPLDSDETHTTQDEIDAAEPGMKRELQNRAKNLRLVASPR